MTAHKKRIDRHKGWVNDRWHLLDHTARRVLKLPRGCVGHIRMPKVHDDIAASFVICPRRSKAVGKEQGGWAKVNPKSLTYPSNGARRRRGIHALLANQAEAWFLWRGTRQGRGRWDSY